MKTAEDRFFAKVERPDDTTACWTWTASQNPQGYGHFHLDGAVIAAHRASWLLFRGALPEGMLVCHTCDNPSCVNPSHLFLGTHTDNARDKMQKGRHTWANKTHCIRDHQLSGDNLYVGPNGLRTCRECTRLRERANYRKKNPNARAERARRSDCGVFRKAAA